MERIKDICKSVLTFLPDEMIVITAYYHQVTGCELDIVAGVHAAEWITSERDALGAMLN
jgi:hypothetical protein